MILRWDVITIGNISRNRYWGESEEKPLRPAICTCTLIVGEGYRLLVDPSLEDDARMRAELDRRTGLRLDDIDLAFLTHSHGDHHYGLKHLRKAQWLAATGVADEVNASGKYDRKIVPVSGKLRDEIDVISTPGHTLTHHSLRFDCDGLSIVVSGDAVMTRDFWNDRRGYHNSVDPELASRTIGKLAEIADIVVPGHDNYFLARRDR